MWMANCSLMAVCLLLTWLSVCLYVCLLVWSVAFPPNLCAVAWGIQALNESRKNFLSAVWFANQTQIATVGFIGLHFHLHYRSDIFERDSPWVWRLVALSQKKRQRTCTLKYIIALLFCSMYLEVRCSSPMRMHWWSTELQHVAWFHRHWLQDSMYNIFFHLVFLALLGWYCAWASLSLCLFWEWRAKWYFVKFLCVQVDLGTDILSLQLISTTLSVSILVILFVVEPRPLG